MLDRQVSVTEQNVALMKETVRTMEAMKEAGMTTEAAVAQSKGAYHQTEASLADLKRQVRETRILSPYCWQRLLEHRPWNIGGTSDAGRFGGGSSFTVA